MRKAATLAIAVLLAVGLAACTSHGPASRAASAKGGKLPYHPTLLGVGY